MRTLILGGTIFLGRHIVDAALARGHEVVLFNRGRHNPELFPELERLRGDRDGDLRGLEGRRFDMVIDTCGFVPRIVRASAQLLADELERVLEGRASFQVEKGDIVTIHTPAGGGFNRRVT